LENDNFGNEKEGAGTKPLTESLTGRLIGNEGMEGRICALEYT